MAAATEQRGRHPRAAADRRRGGRRRCPAQTMLEFALVIPLFLFLLYMSITFAIVGQYALAVSQLASAGARYAAVNSGQSAGQLSTYIKSGALGSPTITGGGGANLTVTVVPASGFGQPVTVTVSYDLSSNVLVSDASAMFALVGLSNTIPTVLTATQSAMSE